MKHIIDTRPGRLINRRWVTDTERQAPRGGWAEAFRIMLEEGGCRRTMDIRAQSEIAPEMRREIRDYLSSCTLGM